MDDPTEYGLSGVSTISPLPVYNLVTPSQGEFLNTYSPYTITWTVEDHYSAYCYLEYSVNNGKTWEVINNAMNQGNSGSYEWFTANADSEAVNDILPGQVQTVNSIGLKDGMYLLRLTSEGNSTTRKIVIKH